LLKAGRLEHEVKTLVDQQEKRRYPRYSIELPLEYWETGNACRGGLVYNVGREGLSIYSVHDMPIGWELEIRVFFPNEYEFDGFRARGKIVWKDSRYETDWKGYQYGLEFVQIPAEDRWKLFYIIKSHLKLEEISRGEGMVFGDLPSETAPVPDVFNLDFHREEGGGGRDLWQRLMTKFLHLS
jgi:hypothetical protein